MKITTITNEIASENTYILENKNSLIIIDPGSNGQDILSSIARIDKPIAAILLTHTHYDHIISLDLVRAHYDWPSVYVSPKEASWLFTPKDNLSGLIRHADIPDVITKPAEELFISGKNYHVDDFNFTVLETPGHSIGGVSFVFDEEEIVITGDALFFESVGRSDLPTGDFDQLSKSIKEKLFTLPNHYQVFPGHGKPTTIGHEKNFNPFLK
ncbi:MULTISPECIES: MBL fold metallo-hydrolase [Streptococcus]|uniref:MBL fold metallo-hydrolase n=3 Tax=Streptococcus parauberis TaxID=1348 RepID=A0A1S1ZPY5_9STRE|nr:MBL fold metallo-hydrolase [Streptococcus parauberis]AUT05652.1 Hydroxyacylglutathione hydrolase [Streptococcus parauberis]EGE54207.1 metallo-beta-lactamase domain protein [Streptococcus parauberis NCFD 2020]EMG26325.1 Hydroxyacylglutathione hydrolase [Streptococcus parauberis KRS-02083]KYP17674.1 putative metallo-hydrolase [Streptococcus parauberis]KYP18672.1 putative metallo-hydrolase [Streptococcus parauberis]